MATKPLVSDYLVPPGQYVREALAHYGMTQSELADRMGRPMQAISEIVNGKKQVTEETAFELESVLGTPAHVWLNLECIYRYGMEANERGRRLSDQGEMARAYPYNEIAKIGYVPHTRNQRERVSYLLKFFGLARLDIVQQTYGAAFRIAAAKKPSPHALAAWLRIGEIEAAKLELPVFNRDRLRQVIPNLRRATGTMGEVDDVLRNILGPAGVAFVAAPHLPHTYANGAAYWHGSRAIVLLSVRGAYSDIFWFSLFHEVAHLLLHDRAQTFIEGLGLTSLEEDEANIHACNTLIPPAAWKSFEEVGDFSVSAVRAFAGQLEISPAIIVGRLMREHNAFDGYHHLRALRDRVSIA